MRYYTTSLKMLEIKWKILFYFFILPCLLFLFSVLKVQVELKALLEHSNFSELQSSVKGLMGDPSDGLQAVHLLVSAA